MNGVLSKHEGWPTTTWRQRHASDVLTAAVCAADEEGGRLGRCGSQEPPLKVQRIVQEAVLPCKLFLCRCMQHSREQVQGHARPTRRQVRLVPPSCGAARRHGHGCGRTVCGAVDRSIPTAHQSMAPSRQHGGRCRCRRGGGACPALAVVIVAPLGRRRRRRAHPNHSDAQRQEQKQHRPASVAHGSLWSASLASRSRRGQERAPWWHGHGGDGEWPVARAMTMTARGGAIRASRPTCPTLSPTRWRLLVFCIVVGMSSGARHI